MTLPMSLVSRLRPAGRSGFGYGSTAEQVTSGLDLSGRHFLVTGVGSGLGRESARVLLLRGATVWGAARSEARARDGLRGFAGNWHPVACDLADVQSVRTAVARVSDQAPPLDGIIANAGVMALPRLETIDGYEKQYMVNHVGHFVLVTGLLGRLSSHGRIVLLSSQAHRAAPSAGIDFDNLDGARGYRPWQAYGRSKLANLLFARALAQRLAPGQTSNAVHPGVIHTDLGRHLPRTMAWGWAVCAPLLFKSVEEGAATQCFVATRPELQAVTGRYFSDCNERLPSLLGRDDALAERLFRHTEELVAHLP